MATIITNKKKKVFSSKLGSALAVFENTTKANQEHNARDSVVKSGGRRNNIFKPSLKKPAGSICTGSSGGAKVDKNEVAATAKRPVVEVMVTAPKKSDKGTKGGVQDRRTEVINKFQALPHAETKPTEAGYDDKKTQKKRAPSARLLIKAFEVNQRDEKENSHSKVKRNFTIPQKRNQKVESVVVSSVVGRFESVSTKEDSESKEESTKESLKGSRLPSTTTEASIDTKTQSLPPLAKSCERSHTQNTISDGIDNKVQIPPYRNVLKMSLKCDNSSRDNNKSLEEEGTSPCAGERCEKTTYSPKSHRERHETDISALLESTTSTDKNMDVNILVTDSSPNDDVDDEDSYYELEVITNEDDDNSQNDQLSQLHVVEGDVDDDCSLWEEKTVDTEEELLWEEESVNDDEEFVDVASE